LGQNFTEGGSAPEGAPRKLLEVKKHFTPDGFAELKLLEKE
jgi:hypothetical protein